MNVAIADAPSWVRPLQAIADKGAVGGKAYHLGEMIRLGLRVPAGFVISHHALAAFLAHNNLASLIAAEVETIDHNNPASLRAAASAIHDMVVQGEVLPALRKQLARLRKGLPGSLIVRSSAVGEDGAKASFAGQLDSILGVASMAELEDAVRRCWASLWSARCLSYQWRRGVTLAKMGVVVQRLIDSRVSGVLFTVSPNPEEGDVMLGEYCLGTAEALVLGQVNPGSFSIMRTTHVWLLRTRYEPPEERPSAPNKHADNRLLFTDAQMQGLARRGLSLEAHFGAPQDIEWTIDEDGDLHFVQSRAITTATLPTASAAPSAEVLWSNANVNENFPDPISPLLYSVAATGYYHYFRNLALALGISKRRVASMEHGLRYIIGVHGARMYYNLTHIHGFIRLAPFGDTFTRYFNDFVGVGVTAQKEAAPLSGGGGRGKVGQALEALLIVAKTTWRYLFIQRHIRAFEQTIDVFAARWHPDKLADMSQRELLDGLRTFIDIRTNRWTNASLADTAATVCYGVLKSLLRRALPDDDQTALHNTLLKGLPEVVSSEPIVALWALSRKLRADPILLERFASESSEAVLTAVLEDDHFADFRRSFEVYLEQWGFRCSGELMLTQPSLQEDPSDIIDILKTYALIQGPSPLEVMQRQNDERLEETARLMKTLPPLTTAIAVRLALKGTHGSIRLRERARLKQALLYSRLRRIVLTIGDGLVSRGTLHERDEVFFLSWQELDALLSGNAMFSNSVAEQVAVRQREHARLSATTPPDRIRLPFGEYFRSDTVAAPAADEAPRLGEGEAEVMRGVGACGGQVTANAAVLRDLGDAHLLALGDVLVTRQTDPGWGPVFFLIKGLVMERGGMLSHGAIIAREFGIPSVVGVKDATRIIRQGVRVQLDGDRGSVRVIGE